MSRPAMFGVRSVLIVSLLAGCAPSPAQTAEPPAAPVHRDAAGVRVGMLADDVLELRGQANRTEIVGEDQFGLLVEWWYADSVYTMARREVSGITAYRVIEIRAP